MLNLLMDAKRRREQGLRAGLARLATEDDGLAAREVALQARRSIVLDEWRALGACSGYYDQRALERLRSAIARLSNEEQTLRRQLDALAAERTQLAQTRAEQEGLLRKILRTQEKLLMIQENLP